MSAPGLMGPDEAQAYHDEQQGVALCETEGTDTPHYGGCWCCCDDCGFDFAAVNRGEGVPGAEFAGFEEEGPQ